MNIDFLTNTLCRKLEEISELNESEFNQRGSNVIFQNRLPRNILHSVFAQRKPISVIEIPHQNGESPNIPYLL